MAKAIQYNEELNTNRAEYGNQMVSEMKTEKAFGIPLPNIFVRLV